MILNKEYTLGLLRTGKREIQRGFLDYRNVVIKTRVLENAEGSAQVDIGNTRVLAGVKLDVGDPMRDKPNEGALTTSAELLPLASAEYEMGPPSPQAIEFARVVDRGIRAAGVVDTGVLFIEEGKVWNVYTDLYVLNFDGNLFDAGTLAGVAALLTAKQPKYEDGKVVREGNIGKLKTGGIATSCTYAKVGNNILLDPSGNEEELMSARITVANDENYIHAMQKGLGGAFSISEIEKAIETTFEKSKELRSWLNKAVSD